MYTMQNLQNNGDQYDLDPNNNLSIQRFSPNLNIDWCYNFDTHK